MNVKTDLIGANAPLETTDPGTTNRGRGRPRTRYADRTEQVRQNMRLYRARRAAELEALAKALGTLEKAVASGDTSRTFRAAAAVAGLWSEASLREQLIRSMQRRSRQRKTA